MAWLRAMGGGESKKPKYIHLYKEGNECTDITGGYVTNSLVKGYSGVTGVAPSLTKNPTNMVIEKDLSGGGTSAGGVNSVNTINFTGYNKLFIEWDIVTTAENEWRTELRLWIADSLNNTDISNGYISKTVNFNGVSEIDISSINGNNYLLFIIYSSGRKISGTIKRIWLEK